MVMEKLDDPRSNCSGLLDHYLFHFLFFFPHEILNPNTAKNYYAFDWSPTPPLLIGETFVLVYGLSFCILSWLEPLLTCFAPQRFMQLPL